MVRIFLLTAFRFLILIFIAFLAEQFIPYRGIFSFPEYLTKYNLPPVLSAFANFDGIHYVKIASEGYYTNAQAFFPLYPLLIRLVSIVTFGNYIMAGILISNSGFIIGLYFLAKLCQKLHINSCWTILFILFFPTSFFFATVYTESLFFMFVILTLYFLKIGGWPSPGSPTPERLARIGARVRTGSTSLILTSFFAISASLARLVGIFLIIPFFFTTHKVVSKKKNPFYYFFSLAPLLGLLSYMMYLKITYNDPLLFFNAQAGFNAGRSTTLIFLPQVYFRYLKIFLTSQLDFIYFVAFIEFAIFNFILLTSIAYGWKQYKKQNYFLLSIALFSLANIFLPTFTGTFLSIPRFALLSLASFFFLAEIKNTKIKIAILTVFGILQIILFSFFIQGYFVS